jgi:hypothetical protein
MGLRASIVVGCLVLARTAHADERVECARAYEQTQRLQQQGEAGKALEAAERCARPTCPALLAEECKPWVAQLRDQLLPHLEVRARGSDGCMLREVTVEVDRVKQTSQDIVVDVGIHEVRAFDPLTGRIEERTDNLAPKERSIVELSFAPEGTTCVRPGGFLAPTPEPSRVGPKVALGLGITGGVLLVGGLSLGAIGALKRNNLDTCRPNCSDSAISGTRTFFVLGDVVGGVGIAALVAAGAVFLFTRTDDSDVAAAPLAPDGLRVRF